MKIVFQMEFCYFRYADQVSVNDQVLVKGNYGLTPALVVNVSDSVMQGNHNLY